MALLAHGSTLMLLLPKRAATKTACIAHEPEKTKKHQRAQPEPNVSKAAGMMVCAPNLAE